MLNAIKRDLVGFIGSKEIAIRKTKIKILNSYKPFFETDRRTLLLIEVLFAIKRDIIGFIVV